LPAAHGHCTRDTNDNKGVDTVLCTDVIAATAILGAWVMSWPQVGDCSGLISAYKVISYLTADGTKLDSQVGCAGRQVALLLAGLTGQLP